MESPYLTMNAYDPKDIHINVVNKILPYPIFHQVKVFVCIKMVIEHRIMGSKDDAD